MVPPVAKVQNLKKEHIYKRENPHSICNFYSRGLKKQARNIECYIIDYDCNTKPTVGQKRPVLSEISNLPPHNVIDVASKTREHKTRGNTIFNSRFLRKPSKYLFPFAIRLTIKPYPERKKNTATIGAPQN